MGLGRPGLTRACLLPPGRVIAPKKARVVQQRKLKKVSGSVRGVRDGACGRSAPWNRNGASGLSLEPAEVGAGTAGVAGNEAGAGRGRERERGRERARIGGLWPEGSRDEVWIRGWILENPDSEPHSGGQPMAREVRKAGNRRLKETFGARPGRRKCSTRIKLLWWFLCSNGTREGRGDGMGSELKTPALHEGSDGGES